MQCGGAAKQLIINAFSCVSVIDATINVRGVRTDRWKLIRYPTGDGSPDRFTAELYDLQADPYELRNLITEPSHAEQRQVLERLLEETSRTAGPDSMPVLAVLGGMVYGVAFL